MGALVLGYGGLISTYGSMSLTVKSPVQSFTEPLSLAEVKEYLNLPERSPVDNAEDDLLNGYITAAREIAEGAQGRDLVRKQWDLSLDAFLGYQIELRDPLVSVDLVQYRDSTGATNPLVENTGYLVNTAKHPGIITPIFNSFWPSFTGWPSSAVLIRFTSGFSSTDAFWSDAGSRIKVGMKLLISGWFNNRLPYAIAKAGSIEENPAFGGVTALLSFGGIKHVR